MKYVYFYFGLVVFVLFFNGCGKKTNPQLAQNYYKLSILELGESEQTPETMKKALNYVDLALSQDEDSKYLALKASILFKLGYIKDSKRIFKQSLSKDLDPILKAETLNNYACLLAQKGKTDEALRIWQDIEKDKNYLTPQVALFNQSKVYFEQDELKTAKEKLIRSISLEPSYIDARYYLSQVFVKLRDFESAKKELTTVLFLAPEHEAAKKLSNSIMY